MSERDPLTGQKKDSTAESLQKNTNSWLRILTIVAHLASLILAILVANGIGSKYPRHHLMTDVIDVKSGTVKESVATIKRLEAPVMQVVSDIVVLVTSLLLLARDLNVEMVKNAIDYSRTGLQGYLTSLVHVASYGFTSYISTLMVYTFFGGKSFMVALILFISTFAAELSKHMNELNDNKQLNQLLGMIGALPLAQVLVIMILSIANSENSEGGWLFLMYIIAVGVKLAHEFLHSMSELYKKNFDRRQVHMILDIAIKGGLAWCVITREMALSGEPHDVGAEGWADAMPWVTLVLTIAALVGAYFIPNDPRSDVEAPTGSLEERTRMLQVA